jgi:aerobic-type carbon monoxide dehydrogenase small subunit (CoxS/CutS family)
VLNQLEINGERRAVGGSLERPLLWVLRDELGLKGTKYGCGVGVCGICTVDVDGEIHRACVTALRDVLGRSVTTIEGLADEHPLVRAWIAEHVPQCGYCQPGQVMVAASLLAKRPVPDDATLAAALSGVLCRCGTYPRIRRAIRRVCEHRNGVPSGEAAPVVNPELPAPGNEPFAPNPSVRIHRDGRVTVVIDRSEMGQGVLTSLSMLVAEELEVGLERIRTELTPAEAAYAKFFDRRAAHGGGSTSSAVPGSPCAGRGPKRAPRWWLPRRSCGRYRSHPARPSKGR